MPSARSPEQIAVRTFITRRDTIRRKLFQFAQLTGSEMAVFGRHNGEVYSFGTEEFLESLGVQVNTRLPNDLPDKPTSKLSSAATSSLSSTSTSELQPEPSVGSIPDYSPRSNSPTQTPRSRTPSTPRRSSPHSPRSCFPVPLADRTRRRGGSTSPLRGPVSRRTVSPTPLKGLSQFKLKSLKSLRYFD